MIRTALVGGLMLLVLSTGTVVGASRTVQMWSNDTFYPVTVKLALGTSVAWKNTDSEQHNATARSGSGKLATFGVVADGGKTSSAITFDHSGTYPYYCTIHFGMNGKIQVKMSASPTSGTRTTTFTLTFATQYAGSGYIHDVQWRKKGGTWAVAATTAAFSMMWHPSSKGTFQFRSRLRYTTPSPDQVTGWSPVLNVVVS